jgi:hypothetical protein
MNQICQNSDNLYLYVSMGSTTMKITMRFRFNKIITLGLLFLGFAPFAEAQWQFTQSSKKTNTYDYQGLHVGDLVAIYDLNGKAVSYQQESMLDPTTYFIQYTGLVIVEIHHTNNRVKSQHLLRIY